ncbi:uncharacterized protein CC84DRAFT_519668 [Paraphaeosphaeria sporulosa]|uniref:Uncharacterized protein n=1 Tax=Paraphaeosphaeria sporulosa TaxID=1460663 RepID=A0A177CVP6_9PLEO|nr:uncharacterized protein CC84DRAFT_519668 [Paraphaeosphaeria sporulosa]OAG11098.1 hypothetical protein CC84DRAFT_519668 [Paraphaeosphaeria sporulosa]
MYIINRFSILVILLSLCWQIGADTCGTADIASGAVTGCECAPSFNDSGCNPCTDKYCNDASLFGNLHTCEIGCTSDNINCNACYLYFNGVCRCVKNTALDCINKGGDWWLLNSHTLISTQKQIPGVLQLHSDNKGWELGQMLLGSTGITLPPGGNAVTRKTGTLAVNSVHARTEEQIHIHVCDNPNSPLRRYLSGIDPTTYTSLTTLPTSFANFPQGTVHCQASKTPGETMNVAEITAQYLNTVTKPCDKSYVGAGVIFDSRDYTWGCLTTTGHSGEDLFCKLT